MKSKKQIVPLRWLLFAVLLTFSISSVTLSRYMTMVAGGDAARVAKFDVTISGGEKVSIDGSNSEENMEILYILTVSNNSEVAVAYTIELVSEAEIASGVQFTIGEKSYSTDGIAKNFVFDGFTLKPNTEIQHQLKVTALLGSLESLKEDISTKMDIIVNTVQVD